MGGNGQPLYAGSDSSSVMQHCSGSSSCKALSPSQQGSTCRANVRHLVDLSSGSTCCSSSASSSPHTLMQGPSGPPVPSLPASMTQGVMLFAASELRGGGEQVAGSSPTHYASQQQYSTQQYHPYLVSSGQSATLGRGHYEANMPTQLYTDEQLVVSYLQCQLITF